MLWSSVNIKYSIHRVEYTQRMAYTEYSIHRVSHSSWTAYTEDSIHRVQHTPSTAYPVYCIQHVQHHPKINCLLHAASLSSCGRPCWTQLSTFPQLRVDQWMESQLPSCLPPQLLVPDTFPPSTAPMTLDHGLKVYLQTRSITASKCISNLAQWPPPSASRNSYHYTLQVHL
jgi:hypothetical protein